MTLEKVKEQINKYNVLNEYINNYKIRINNKISLLEIIEGEINIEDEKIIIDTIHLDSDVYFNMDVSFIKDMYIEVCEDTLMLYISY